MLHEFLQVVRTTTYPLLISRLFSKNVLLLYIQLIEFYSSNHDPVFLVGRLRYQLLVLEKILPLNEILL